MMVLKSHDLKDEFRNLKVKSVHLSHFDVNVASVRSSNRITYQDDRGFVAVLKERGCIKPKTFKQIPRRRLNF